MFVLRIFTARSMKMNNRKLRERKKIYLFEFTFHPYMSTSHNRALTSNWDNIEMALFTNFKTLKTTGSSKVLWYQGKFHYFQLHILPFLKLPYPTKLATPVVESFHEARTPGVQSLLVLTIPDKYLKIDLNFKKYCLT